MYWVTTTALFVFGFSLAFTAVKALFELPSWVVRSALYVIVTTIYVIALTTSREAGFGWFHLFWSIILMVLIFGLLQKQSSHVCRWTLYIASSVLVTLLMFAVAEGIHQQTNRWLHQVYINRGAIRTPMILLSVPVGVGAGLMFAWVGTRKDPMTGHAKAAHWNWWCVPLNVVLLLVVVCCLVLNDRALCAERDAIIEREKFLRGQIELLSPQYRTNQWPARRLNFRLRATGLIVDGQHEELWDVAPDLLAEIANEILWNSKHSLDNGNVPQAIARVVAATELIDLGIAPAGRGSHLFLDFERKRIEAIENLVGSCESQHSTMLTELVTKRPYATLKPPPVSAFIVEREKLDAVRLALRSFTSDRSIARDPNRRVSFWWRFLALQHANSAATSELDFRLPVLSSAQFSSDRSVYDRPQFIRMAANAAVRGSIVMLNDSRPPQPDELFKGDLTAKEFESLVVIQNESGWVLYENLDGDEHDAMSRLSADRLRQILDRRGTTGISFEQSK